VTNQTPQNALAHRTPETALARAEAWASLSDAERKRRAAAAIRDGDTPALWALTEAHVTTFGRKGLRVSPHTLAAYRRGVDVLLAWVTAQGLKLHQFTRQEALRYTRHLEAANLSPATVNLRLAAARTFAQAIMWAGLLSGDPFARVAVSDPTPATEKRHPYTAADLGALLEAANPRERALVLLGADAGLRVAEAAALTWADVDQAACSLVVRSGKGGKRRTVALTERACEALRAIREGGDTETVFGVTIRRLQAILTALCGRAGVEARGVHALRHSAGTRLYSATKDLKLVARHLGHASTRPTELYAHLADDAYRAGVDALGESKRGAAA
jgi:integrase/recombinase XerC